MTKEELLQSVKVEMTESIASNGIFESVNLPDEIKGSLVTVIDNAVQSLAESQVAQMADKLIEANEALLAKQVEELVEAEIGELSTNLNDFCEGLADKYLEENKVENEFSMKAHMFESLFGGLVQLVRNNNIAELTEEEINVVDELSEELDENKTVISHLTASYAKVKGELSEMKREVIIGKHTSGLTESQIEAVKEISAEAEFNESTFGSIVESIVDLVKTSEEASSINESTDVGPEGDDLSGLNYIPESTDQTAPKTGGSKYVF